MVVPPGGEPFRGGPRDNPPIGGGTALPLMEPPGPADVCLMPPAPEERASYQASIAAYQSGQRAGSAPKEEPDGSPPGWPGKGTMGGNLPPTAAVLDPWPTFAGMAADRGNGAVALTGD